MEGQHPTSAHRATARLHPGDATGSGVARPRIGRPRASDVPGSGDVREDILLAATELISTLGYAKATTRAIAEKAGLRQASLFHYFRNKEDLLATLFERIIAVAVGLVDDLTASDLSPAERLYALSYGDVHNMTSSESNIALLQFVNEAQGKRFEGFWSDYQRLRDAHATYLQEGIEVGSLAADDVLLATDVILGTIDGVAMWFAPGKHDPARVAGQVADAVALYALADKAALDDVRSAGLAFLAARWSRAE